MTRTILLLVLLLAFALLPASSRPVVFAFHYGWYGTPEFYGKWFHWDQGGHKPDKTLHNNLPDIAAADHPIKLYDSSDPAVIDRHLKQAQDAGIDVFIESFARGGFKEKTLRMLIEKAQKTPVKVCAYYESPVRLNGSQDLVANAVEDFNYIIENYGNHPAYFKVDGKPVIFVYGRAVEMLRGKWLQVLSQVRSRHSVFVSGDSFANQDYNVFDTLHIYNPLVWITQNRDINRSAKAVVDVARSKGRIASVTVIPGYDDSNLGRKNPIIVPRDNGALYKRMWSAAVKAKPDWIIICSFNEWHEGTEIEPSVEYGEKYLKLTKEFTYTFKSGNQIID